MDNEIKQEATEQTANPAETPRMFTEKEIRAIAIEEVEKKDKRNNHIIQAILGIIIAILLGLCIVFFMMNIDIMKENAQNAVNSGFAFPRLPFFK